MHTFEIADEEIFPNHLEGIIVPDDGRAIHFHDNIPDYYGSGEPLIALFVFEHETRYEIPLLDNPDLIDLRAIVTFGRRLKGNTANDDNSHFKRVVHELHIPYMRLRMPDTYPGLTNGLDQEDPFFKTWIENSPLKDIYHKHVTLDQDGTNASFGLTKQ
jgi:hypothetical protein